MEANGSDQTNTPGIDSSHLSLIQLQRQGNRSQLQYILRLFIPCFGRTWYFVIRFAGK